MKSTTNTYKQIIASGDTRNFLVTVNMTLADSTTLTLTEENITQNTFKIMTASSGTETLDIGSAIIGSCEFTIDNFDDTYTEYDFFNATAVVWVKLVGDSEYHRMGFYTVDEPTYAGSMIKLMMLDNMWKFDVPLSESHVTFPCTIGTAVSTVCTDCGVVLASQNFHGSDYVLTSAPDKDINCRELLSYCAMIGCNFCVMDDQGRLLLRWYDTDIYESTLDGGTFSTTTTPYSDGDVAHGGTFRSYKERYSYDGGSFTGQADVAYFTRLMSRNIGTDEIFVTGVKFIINNVTYLAGRSGYVITLENPFVTSKNARAILNLIWEVLEGFKFRTYNVTALPDLAPEVGDCVGVSYKGNMVYSYLTNYTFTPSLSTASLGAETPTRALSTRYSQAVQAAVDVARTVSTEEISSYDLAVQAMNALSVNAMGAYQDFDELATGGRVYYLSNHPITKNEDNECVLTSGATVFKTTGEGLFVSTSGGTDPSQRVWVNGYNAQTGELTVNVLNAIGLNADWVVTGLLRDSQNRNYWNLDTGEFALSANSTMGGETVQSVFNSIDGKTQTFTSQPTVPYHVGDLWFNSTTSDIMTCTTSRTTGSFTASDWEKRNKYTDDTLAKATYGTCTTDRRTQEKEVVLPNFVLYEGAKIAVQFTYVTTVANPTLNVNNTGAKPIYARGSAITSAYYWQPNAICEFVYDGTNWNLQVQNQREIFNALTNAGETQGIYLSNQKLYINASYIQSGGMSADYIVAGELTSQNYSDPGTNEIYASAGTKLNLNSGVILTKAFLFDGSSSELYARQLVVKPNPNDTSTITTHVKVMDNSNNYSELRSASLHIATDYNECEISDVSGYWGSNRSNYAAAINQYGLDASKGDDQYVSVNYDSINKYYYGTTLHVSWSSSDRRVKENIDNLNKELSIEFINKTEPVSFKYKNIDGKHYGMIAQDVRTLLDDLGETDSALEYSVGDNKNLKDQRNIDYHEYIPHLINYVKDLREIVDRQQEEIELLKAEVKALKGE